MLGIKSFFQRGWTLESLRYFSISKSTAYRGFLPGTVVGLFVGLNPGLDAANTAPPKFTVSGRKVAKKYIINIKRYCVEFKSVYTSHIPKVLFKP